MTNIQIQKKGSSIVTNLYTDTNAVWKTQWSFVAGVDINACGSLRSDLGLLCDDTTCYTISDLNNLGILETDANALYILQNPIANQTISGAFNLTLSDGNFTGVTGTFDGNLNINSLTYSFPSSRGSSGDFLTDDGLGNLTW